MFLVILNSPIQFKHDAFGDTYFIGIMVRKSALDKRWFIMDLSMQHNK
jgi:hypothetical protein